MAVTGKGGATPAIVKEDGGVSIAGRALRYGHQVKGGNLANQTDFLVLYEKLGLDPGCELSEFKRAYRRHVAMLHPDRPAEARAGGGATGAGPLQEVTAQYGAAMEFHRRHGRLPGAATAPPRFNARDAAVPHVSPPAPVSPGAPTRSRSKRLILLAVIATGVLLWNIVPVASLTQAGSTQVPADDDGDSSDPQVKTVLSIGMSADDVRAIEGDPQSIHDHRWGYGKSWVLFDHGEVIDWYSVPPHPLHANGRPPQTHR